MTDTQALRKARGAFFTPPELSRFIADWAIHAAQDVVLEPSCGEASFLTAAGRRLRTLGAKSADWENHLHGVEIHAPSARRASELLASDGLSARVRVADFFDVEPTPTYDAVIGNPPFVRYQDFAGDARAKGLEAALKQGVRLTGLANSWAAFVVHAAQFLKPSGRLGLVLPAELLAVNYAAEVRRFLLRRFERVRLVMFEELVFPGVLEEVVLLLAEGTGGAPHFEVHQARDLHELERPDMAAWTWFTPDAGGKWTPALLPGAALDTYRKQVGDAGFSRLLDWGETYLGAVTGGNRYFTLTAEQVRELGLSERELLHVSPPGSRHLRGLTFSKRAWQQLANEGERCFMFAPDPKAPSAAALRYIAAGEAMRVHEGYKCRNRKPWWRVPVVPRPDLLLTYMDHERPRLTTNAAGVDLLNSLYGVKLRPEGRKLGCELLPVALLNSLSLLGAEMEGRAYGGGLLKLEPKEADRLPVPSLSLLKDAAKDLRAVKPQLTGALRSEDIAEAVKLIDRVVLARHLGLSFDEIQALREAREILFARRVARGKSGRATN